MEARTAEVLTHSRYGPPEEVLGWEEWALPDPGPGEVVVGLLAAAIHPSDLGMIAGQYAHLRDLPAVGGREGVAEVLLRGEGVDPSWEGAVVRLPDDLGAWRQRAVVPVDELELLPPDLDPGQLALAGINPPTALCLLREFVDLQPGEWVLQNAGNSGLGLALIQLARAQGLRTVSLVRREELREPLEVLGADAVLLDHPEAAEEIRAVVGAASPRLALNSVGGESLRPLLRSLAEGGTLVTFGGMSGEKIRYPTRELIFHDLRLRGFWLDLWKRTHGPAAFAGLLRETYEAIRADRLRLPVEAVYPLRDYRQALAHHARGRLGKILFTDGGGL